MSKDKVMQATNSLFTQTEHIFDSIFTEPRKLAYESYMDNALSIENMYSLNLNMNEHV